MLEDLLRALLKKETDDDDAVNAYVSEQIESLCGLIAERDGCSVDDVLHRLPEFCELEPHERASHTLFDDRGWGVRHTLCDGASGSGSPQEDPIFRTSSSSTQVICRSQKDLYSAPSCCPVRWGRWQLRYGGSITAMIGFELAFFLCVLSFGLGGLVCEIAHALDAMESKHTQEHGRGDLPRAPERQREL
jgi:hypothetical protein